MSVSRLDSKSAVFQEFFRNFFGALESRISLLRPERLEPKEPAARATGPHLCKRSAGAIATEPRWTHPSEIVAAARDQVEHTLKAHRLSVTTEPDVPVQLDARLTASALAQLLENAAQYAPRGTTIEVSTDLTCTALLVRVRDHGPGIAPADLPHVFDRFYRGAASRTRASGSGMGLSIARGLLAAERGQVWVENRPDGGAQFTISVPVSVTNVDDEVAAS
jgi:two-component system sensor histidine kinase KdpD